MIEVWTIGHSTHAIEDFEALLSANRVEMVLDVRTVPKSRRSGHFAGEALARRLAADGFGYRHLPRLGGWRRTSPASPNTGWRNRSFRGYADYALTEEFDAGLAELIEIAAGVRAAMMCSEALWWRCHRRLVADRVVASGGVVEHIGSSGRTSPHELTPFASEGPDGRLIYPDPD